MVTIIYQMEQKSILFGYTIHPIEKHMTICIGIGQSSKFLKQNNRHEGTEEKVY